MPDHYDTLITTALDELRTGAVSSVRAPGTAHFPGRAKRQRRRLTGISVAGALFVAVPAAAVVAGQQQPPPVRPTPADAKLFPVQLADEGAMLPPNPKWDNCSLRIGRKPAAHTPGAVYAEQVVYTNLDDDPALETAAFVRCMLPGGGFVSQVVAYERDASGAPAALGAIVPPLTPHEVVGVQQREAGDGVTARVLYEAKPGPVSDPVGQLRDFAWKGKAFRQVAGETSFPEPLAADIAVSAPDRVRLSAKGEGLLKVTVTNLGPNPTRELKVTLNFGTDAADLTRLDDSVHSLRPTRIVLQPGQSTTIDLPLTVDATLNAVRVGIYSHIIDSALGNNTVVVPLIRQ